MQVSWGHGPNISSSPSSASARDKATVDGRAATGPSVKQVASVAQSALKAGSSRQPPSWGWSDGGSEHSEVQGFQMLCTQ